MGSTWSQFRLNTFFFQTFAVIDTCNQVISCIKNGRPQSIVLRQFACTLNMLKAYVRLYLCVTNVFHIRVFEKKLNYSFFFCCFLFCFLFCFCLFLSFVAMSNYNKEENDRYTSNESNVYTWYAFADVEWTHKRQWIWTPTRFHGYLRMEKYELWWWVLFATFLCNVYKFTILKSWSHIFFVFLLVFFCFVLFCFVLFLATSHIKVRKMFHVKIWRKMHLSCFNPSFTKGRGCLSTSRIFPWRSKTKKVIQAIQVI